MNKINVSLYKVIMKQGDNQGREVREISKNVPGGAGWWMLAMICTIWCRATAHWWVPLAHLYHGDADYEEISNISVDGNLSCLPHILFHRTAVFRLNIRVSVVTEGKQNWVTKWSLVVIAMVEKIPWTAAPSSTSIWEQILEFRSGNTYISSFL